MWLRSILKQVAQASSLVCAREDVCPTTPGRRGRRRRSREHPADARLLFETLEARSLLSFSAAVNYTVGVGPQSVAAGLINGDSALDLVTTNSSENTVSVMLNQGGGTFAAAVGYPVGASPFGVATGDFNGDGRADVVTANFAGNNVSVLLSQVNGTLGTAVSYAAGTNPISVAVADLNGDTKLDLAVGNYNGNDVSVLLGNGTGGFGATQNFATGYSPRSVVVGDFDGDQKLDLSTANEGGNDVSVLAGDGLGSFAAPQNSPVPGTVRVDPPTSLAVGDVNRDGMLDLLVAGSENDWYCPYFCYPVTYGLASVLIGRGDGIFTAGASFRLGSDYYEAPLDAVPYGIAAADFNGDGWDDFAVDNGDDGGVNVFLNEGDGSFFDGGLYATGAGPMGLTAADLNGDSRPDLAAASAGANSTSVLINAADWQPWLRIEGVTVTEGNSGTTNADFTVRIWPAPAQTVTVSYATVDGSATAGSDYVAASGTLTFSPGGPLSQTVPVAVKGDAVWEYDETFSVQLSAVGATILNAYAFGTIMNDEPQVSVDSATVTEGNSGTVQASFTISLSFAATQTVTVTYATADASATAGSDYQSASGTLTIPAGQTTGTITVSVIGDRIGEQNETFVVNLSGATNASIVDSQGVGTIVDDEPRLSIGDATVIEGNIGTRAATFTVTLSAASSEPVTVAVTTNETAVTVGSPPTSGLVSLWHAEGNAFDAFGSNPGTLTNGTTFASGKTGQAFSLDGTDDYVSVPSNASLDPTAAATLSAWIYLDTLPSAAGHIMSIMAKGGPGRDLDFQVETDNRVRFYVATGAPNVVASTTVLQAGQWYHVAATYTAASNVKMYINGVLEATTSISATRLTNTNPFTIGENAQWTGRYFDGLIDEPALHNVALSAAEIATYATTATAGSDYQAASGTLTIPAGQTTGTITVSVIGDRIGEQNETFVVNLSGATNASIVDSQGVGTIVDDEPRLSINNMSIKEGNSGTKVMTFNVTLSAAYDQPVTVHYATQDSSATVADNDYVATSGTLAFAAGQTSQTISVVIKGDRKTETDEYFNVVLSSVSSNALIDNAYGWCTILDDDGPKGRR